jgi:hypothetical protein
MQMDLKYNEDDENCVLTDRSSVYILLFPHPPTLLTFDLPRWTTVCLKSTLSHTMDYKAETLKLRAATQVGRWKTSDGSWTPKIKQDCSLLYLKIRIYKKKNMALSVVSQCVLNIRL